MLQLRYPTQPYNIQSLKVLRANLIHPRGLTTEELFNHLGDLSTNNWRTCPKVPSGRLSGRRAGGIEEALRSTPPTDPQRPELRSAAHPPHCKQLWWCTARAVR
ncbi:hypothetical protein ATANTOWER_031287 [Ataeniobius toweri]|uniref:Uncharacterized protein n=1 Tax=Ataeniobius toweri TaxID=208326 RepID=A0ABU7ASK0_9TELE|nr:hypothetical protein [Ataeniobius toweri]